MYITTAEFVPMFDVRTGCVAWTATSTTSRSKKCCLFTWEHEMVRSGTWSTPFTFYIFITTEMQHLIYMYMYEAEQKTIARKSKHLVRVYNHAYNLYIHIHVHRGHSNKTYYYIPYRRYTSTQGWPGCNANTFNLQELKIISTCIIVVNRILILDGSVWFTWCNATSKTGILQKTWKSEATTVRWKKRYCATCTLSATP